MPKHRPPLRPRQAPLGSWRKAGEAAHAAGLPRLCLSDPAVSDALVGLPVGGGGAPIMAAWYAGWDAANLAQPVEL